MTANLPWGLWWRQILAVLRLEIVKNYTRKRAIPVYLLAALAPALFAAHWFASARGWSHCNGRDDLMGFAAVFQLLQLRVCIFFGAIAIFLNLFRGEVVEKSLHYYFLAPVRREVLVVGKFLSGLAMMGVVFTISTVATYFVVLGHVNSVLGGMVPGSPMADLPAYVGVTLLACLGYGALFLILGLLFRNPIIPAVLVLGWESVMIFLPAILKKMTVIFYLESLCPVKPPLGHSIFAVTADPAPAYLSVPGLLLLAVGVLVLAGLRIRKMEIRYGTD